MWLLLWKSPNRKPVQLTLKSCAPEGSFAATTTSSAPDGETLSTCFVSPTSANQLKYFLNFLGQSKLIWFSACFEALMETGDRI
jgi:hypothetical protein